MEASIATMHWYYVFVSMISSEDTFLQELANELAMLRDDTIVAGILGVWRERIDAAIADWYATRGYRLLPEDVFRRKG